MMWAKAKLKDVAPSRHSNRKFVAEETVWHLTLDQIESNTGRIVNKQIKPAKEAGNSTYVFDENNVLYSKLRPYLNKVVCPMESGIATTELIPLRPDPEILDRRFLTYYLRSPEFVRFASATVAGVKMPRVIIKKFWEHELPLPPLREQRRIVEILDQADTLRKQRADADKKAARILPALFYQMFGDPATNPRGWDQKPIGSLARVIRGASPRPKGDPRYFGGEIPWIKIGDVHRNAKYLTATEEGVTEEGAAKSVLLQPETLILSNSASVGTPCILKVAGCIHDGFLAFLDLSDEIERDFLYYVFEAERERLISLAPRGSQANLNTGLVKSFRILVPPRPLQRDFVRLAAIFDNISSQARTAGQRIERFWETLLYRAFSGRLTAKWREAHMEELLQEMEHQETALTSG